MADKFQVIDTTFREDEIKRATSQVGFKENLALGHRTTVLHAGVRKIEDEGAGVLKRNVDEGLSFTDFTLDNLAVSEDDSAVNKAVKGSVFRAAVKTDVNLASLGALFNRTGEGVDPEYDKMDHIDTLLEGIPRKYHGDIMANTSLAAAERARARVLLDLDDQEIIALQDFGGLTRFTAMLGDVDLPLVFASGGAFGAAKIGTSSFTAFRAAGLGARGARIGQSLVQNGYAGAQAGALIGTANLYIREGGDAADLINYTVLGTVGGAALGGGGTALKEGGNASLLRLADNYADQIANNAPELTANPYVTDEALTDTPMPIKGSELQGEGSSVGARQTTPEPLGLPERNLVDPLGRMSTEQAELIDKAHRFNHDSGFYDRRAEEADSVLQKMSNSKWATVVGTGMQSKMYNSKSAVMNWLGQTVFESPSGYLRGKATASVLQENYVRKIQTQLDSTRTAMQDWARETGNTIVAGQGVSNAGKEQFFREVMLERNARLHGRNRGSNRHVVFAADGYDNAARESRAILNDHGRGRGREVDGFEDIAGLSDHYTPYVWGPKIGAMIRASSDPTATRKAMEAGLAEGYRNAGMAAGKDADAIAHAVLRRSQLKEAEIDMSVVSLLQADGREFLEDALNHSALSREEVEGIMSRLVNDQSERAKEGFAKGRNELDMETSFKLPDGTELQLVDLLSKNLDTDWHRYTRRAAGSSALARQGITNRAQRKEIISAIHAEQRSLGEEITPRGELEAMFTAFDGGATKGYSKINGGEPSEQGAGVATAKRLVNLAWLNKLGLTQLGETGATIVQHGLEGWYTRGPLSLVDKEIKAGNKRLLDDLSYLLGDIGQDQHHFAEHLNLDEVSKIEGATFAGKVQEGISTASYLQGYTSFFNQIRAHQQKTAALGAADSIVRAAKADLDSVGGISEKLSNRVFNDYGIDVQDLERIARLIQDGTIELTTRGKQTYVNLLKMDEWDADLADTFAASITRNINQVVQKAMAGEQDAWMHTGWGSIMTHLKTFPMQATQKQMVRHFRNNDPMAYAAVGMTFATAMVASNLRAAVDGKDMSQAEHAKRAFAYSNMTGFLPMVYDPLMTVLGLEDKRFNQFSPHSEVTPPVLSFANDAIRLPGALAKAAAGTADGSDMAALRVTPFANTILYGEMTKGIATRNKE